MKIEIVETGNLKENCYIIKDEINKECLIVDPGDDFSKIKDIILDYKVLNVLITHNHFDHTGALEDILNEYKVEVLNKDNLNEIEYKINNFTFKVIFTPGHTSDSICFYFEKDKVLFTGDFLFRDTIGRTDLPTGSNQDMKNSLNLIKTYPKDISIYPGHGSMSTLEIEFKNNIYLK